MACIVPYPLSPRRVRNLLLLWGPTQPLLLVQELANPLLLVVKLKLQLLQLPNFLQLDR
ncbi:hypothetical protein V6Z11_A07G028000 [Gossypium hirsutum]